MAKADRLVICVALLASTGLGCKEDDPPDGPGIPISVLTRNLYLGAEITPLVTIPSPDDVPPAAAAIWASIQASNFPERAKVLAQEIVTLGPDLVALQEVTLYRRQVPSDRNPVPNAEEVVLDFLELLSTEIAARGGTYHVVGTALNVDAELPVADPAGEYDLRLTDRDVILAKDGVETANFASFPFAAKFSFMAGGSGGFPVALTRSWSRVDATVGEAHFTFANAHLEIQSLQPIQTAQAMEMLAGISSVPDPVLLLGDFNSEPGLNSYPLLVAQFDDAWDDAGGGAPGLTCCQDANLTNAESHATDRIDLVLYRGRFRINDIAVTGTDPAADRTPGGFWPSDHFGVSSHVELVP